MFSPRWGFGAWSAGIRFTKYLYQINPNGIRSASKSKPKKAIALEIIIRLRLYYIFLFGFWALLIQAKISSKFNWPKTLANFALSKAFLPDWQCRFFCATPFLYTIACRPRSAKGVASLISKNIPRSHSFLQIPDKVAMAGRVLYYLHNAARVLSS